MSRHSNRYGESDGIFYLGVSILDYRNSDMCNTINEYVRNQRYKDLLRLRYCEGRTYEEIGEIVCYSPQHVKRICKNYHDTLMSHL